MRFPWFWSFWHWTTDSFRAGALLRPPVHGIARHWEVWFAHEATAQDRRAIADVERSLRQQREFVAWIARCWTRDVSWQGAHPPWLFVLGQLARIAPFNGWAALSRYRAGVGSPGVSAVVLAEESSGEATDVRRIVTLGVPPMDDGDAPAIVSEGFQVEGGSLETARHAASSVLRGRGLLLLLALWLAGGRRPYPRPLALLLSLGWIGVVAIMLLLLAGEDPRGRLQAMTALLAVMWGTLLLAAVSVAGTVCVQAWRAGREWGEQLEQRQIRLWMDGGLTVVGGSAGLPFALNVLLAASRSGMRRARRRSWLWERIIGALRDDEGVWAATGSIDLHGGVGPVTLSPKLRACLRHGSVRHVLVPNQEGAGRWSIAHVRDAFRARAPQRAHASLGAPRIGFAQDERSIRSHRCRHLAQALVIIGRLGSGWQAGINAVAVATTVALGVALPDVRAILSPPPAPLAGAPYSTSPYQLWVSLDTPHASRFATVLESEFWANRRAHVMPSGQRGVPARAELQLRRRVRQTTRDAADGVVWVERRHRFLTREFVQGERVGRYSLSYLVRHE